MYLLLQIHLHSMDYCYADREVAGLYCASSTNGFTTDTLNSINDAQLVYFQRTNIHSAQSITHKSDRPTLYYVIHIEHEIDKNQCH